MARYANQETMRHDSAPDVRRNRIRGQMYALRPASQRYVRARIHQDGRAVRIREAHGAAHQIRKLARI